jgi:hypothetical protein
MMTEINLDEYCKKQVQSKKAACFFCGEKAIGYEHRKHSFISEGKEWIFFCKKHQETNVEKIKE